MVPIVLLSCTKEPSAYTIDKAKKNEDVIDIQGKVTNLKKWDEFYDNTVKRKEDSIRLVRYTTLGDAIIYDIACHDGYISCEVDQRRDRAAKTEDRKIKKYKYKDLGKIEKDKSIEYYIRDDKGEKVNILLVSR